MHPNNDIFSEEEQKGFCNILHNICVNVYPKINFREKKYFHAYHHITNFWSTLKGLARVHKYSNPLERFSDTDV